LLELKASKIIEQDDEDIEMEPDQESLDLELDIDTYNSKLFSNSEYGMFSLDHMNPDDRGLLIDQYGIVNEDENDQLYNNRPETNEQKFTPGDTNANGRTIGETDKKKNYSVTYDYIKKYYDTYDFSYKTVEETIAVECDIAYIIFEGRIDKVSFQIMLNETRPKNLIVVNASEKKVQRIQHYIETNDINIKVSHVRQGTLKFQVGKESSKIMLDPSLVNFSHKRFSNRHCSHISERYSVNRIYGKLTAKNDKVGDETKDNSGEEVRLTFRNWEDLHASWYWQR